MYDLNDFIEPADLTRLIQIAKAEDMGPMSRDITSKTLIVPEQRGQAAFVARTPGRLCGEALLRSISACYDPQLQLRSFKQDGDCLAEGDSIAQVKGSLRSILGFERVALNFMTHLSGIATLTDQYVQAVAGTTASIYDTRKTIPGLRSLAKYAVVCGGGRNHRMGLYDAMLVKDNHLAHWPLEQLQDQLKRAVSQVRRDDAVLSFVEVEVDSLEQLERVLPCEPDVVLLDNMSLEMLRQAVAMRNAKFPQIQLEASGGVNLQTVGDIARTGVDRIAVGAITHSAAALDIGLDIL